MRMTKLAIASAVMALGIGAAVAQPATVHVWDNPRGWWDSHFDRDTGADMYAANEVSLDLFGSYWAGQRKFTDVFETNIRNGVWGGGVGLNYFFTRELGLGVDMNIPDNDGNFIDTVQGSLIGRFPVGESGVAPYAFGGGGRSTDGVWQWLGHVGVGVETRLNPVTGIFIDSRYVWADQSSDTILFRAGLRLIF